MRRKYIYALLFAAALAFASPAGQVAASQVPDEHVKTSADAKADQSSIAAAATGSESVLVTIEEVFGERAYYGAGETEGSYVYHSAVFPKDSDTSAYLPEEIHVDGGKKYRLISYELHDQTLSGRKKYIRDSIILKDYEGIDEIPETYKVEVTDKQFGTTTEYELPVKTTQKVNEHWTDSFAFDIVVEHADSGLFQIGNDIIALNTSGDPFAGNERRLLALIGVPSDSYRIDHTEWTSSMYEHNGILYRDAVAFGEKLVYDLEISYEEVITLPDEEGYQISAIYEPVEEDLDTVLEDAGKGSFLDWLKGLWNLLVMFIKEAVQTAKEHPYITAVVFFLLFIAIMLFLAVRRDDEEEEEEEEEVSSRRWHRGPRKGRKK